MRSELGIPVGGAFFAVLATALLLPAAAVAQSVDLDGIPMNGAESTVQTAILNSNSPVKIENRITNNTGSGFTFDWSGAGPGGFCSVLQPNVGGGTTWTWETFANLYNISSPIVFTPELEVPIFGQPSGGGVQTVGDDLTFTVVGKSIYQNDVTPLAAGLLESSLIQFFSPDQTIATCSSNFSPGVYEQVVTNDSELPIVVLIEQLDCCDVSGQILCEGECASYFDDPLNCGGCEIECEGGGECVFGCCTGTSNCNGICSDLEVDSLNCGACGNNCPSDRYCFGGECLCTLGGECGGTCTDLFNDPSNCGACANVCDFSECPTGTGSCSGGECICDDGDGGGGEAAAVESREPGGRAFKSGREATRGASPASLPTGFGDFSQTTRPLSPPDGGWPVTAIRRGGSTTSRSEESTRSVKELGRGGARASNPVPAGGGGGVECSLIDFEGIPHAGLVGTIEGTPSTTFGPSWVALIDADADPNATGNFANEPSPSTAVTFLEVEIADPINFDSGVQFVEVFYSAAAVSLPVTLRAWSGPSGTGTLLDTVLGNTVGTDYDGAPCVGDPTGAFCLWDVMQLVAESNNIRSITLDGAEANFFGFDNMTFCTALPATGACCTGNSCLVTTEANCQSLGGSYQGDDATCEPDTCGDPYVVGIQDAEICVVADAEVTVEPGDEVVVSCEEGALAGREISTQATVMGPDGSISGQGPCQAIVPFEEFIVGEFEPSPFSVLVFDDSKDYVAQPGEYAELRIEVLNLGTEPLVGTAPDPVTAQLVSPPDFFNPLPVTFITDVSSYGDFEALPEPAGCGQETIFNPVTNDVPFALMLHPDQGVDVTRQLELIFDGTVPASGPLTKGMQLTLGIGKSCDPVAGPPYDGIAGLGGAVGAELAPEDYPLNLSGGSFSVGETIALELELFCGASPSDPLTFPLLPHVVSIRHETDGELLGGLIPDVDDRFFACGSDCTFDLDTSLIPAGQVVIGVAMPDSKRYQAGLTLAP